MIKVNGYVGSIVRALRPLRVRKKSSTTYKNLSSYNKNPATYPEGKPDLASCHKFSSEVVGWLSFKEKRFERVFKEKISAEMSGDRDGRFSISSPRETGTFHGWNRRSHGQPVYESFTRYFNRKFHLFSHDSSNVSIALLG